MRDFNPPPSGNDLLDKIFRLARESFVSLRGAITNEHIVPATVKTTDTRVFHGLDGSPSTFEVVWTSGPGVVYESSTPNDNRARYLLLKASADVSVRIRFT